MYSCTCNKRRCFKQKKKGGTRERRREKDEGMSMEARRRRGGKREKEVRRTSGREKSVLRRENSDQGRGGGLTVCRSILKGGGLVSLMLSRVPINMAASPLPSP